jgi:hypothetical protein
MSMNKPIRMPADVYDTLEFSALAFGGIGKAVWYEWDEMRNKVAPVCPLGHLCFAGAVEDEMPKRAFGLSLRRNDWALDDVWPGQRIHFDEWCRRLNVVRGS